MVVEDAVKTVMSGPAAGVIAAAWTARHAGIADVITYDMGGTSSDVALILGGVPSVSAELDSTTPCRCMCRWSTSTRWVQAGP
ncbi:MAG: hydantoinase/oxoprolinase family protein [Geminicoccaceae bacterium]